MRIFATFSSAAAIAALAVLTACSGGGQQSSQPSPHGTAALTNSTGFPLYPNSTIVSTRSFTQDVNAHGAQNGVSVFDAGNGTYTGHEVIAASQGTFGDLSGWIGKVASAPPSGYEAAETGNNPEEHSQAQRYGIDYAAFSRKAADGRHGVLVIVMDPQRVNTRFGAVLGMISKYRSLPAVMRQPIDDEAKTRIGMTISEATAPESPIGAALAALSALQSKNARGIVVIDATKR